jgi:hypothetical protein
MEFTNIVKNVTYKGLNYLFSYYNADNVDAPDINICAECEKGRMLISNEDYLNEVTNYCVKKYVDIQKSDVNS